MRKSKYILFVILLLATSLRLYRLGSFPALNADEAAIGYNAYSLIETGKDEHGNPWPVHFQSFNDFKPGLYFYLVLPFVKYLGLNEWAVRLPGALMGVLTVLVVYFLIKELFPEQKKFSIFSFQFSIGEIAALFLAISPWHIQFSRGGWEVNAATFFITTGVWLFLRAINDPKYYVFSALSFVLSLYSYHAARLIVPLLVFGLLVIYKRYRILTQKWLIIGALTGGLLLVPLGMDLVKGDVLSRAAGVGLFADTGPFARINEQRGEHGDFRSSPAKILHNKPINYGLAFLENWAEHFWGEFLFLSGDDIQRNKVPETGQMYLFDIILVAAGIIFIVKKPKNLPTGRHGWALIILWLGVAPVAAALTFQSPHSLRAHNMVIPLVIISAYGLAVIITWLGRQKKYLLVIGYWSLVITIAWSFTRYLHMYWVHMAKEYPFSSQYGAKELVSFVKEKQGDYKKVIVTDRYDQPYVLFLFYLKYPPEQFQKEHVLTARDRFGFSTVRNFDKYRFRAIDFDVEKPENPNSLVVGTDEEIPNEANIIKEIYFPSGEVAFKVVAN